MSHPGHNKTMGCPVLKFVIIPIPKCMRFTLNDQAVFFPHSVVPLSHLLTLVPGLWYLVLPLPTSFWDNLVGEYAFGIYHPDLCISPHPYLDFSLSW